MTNLNPISELKSHTYDTMLGEEVHARVIDLDDAIKVVERVIAERTCTWPEECPNGRNCPSCAMLDATYHLEMTRDVALSVVYKSGFNDGVRKAADYTLSPASVIAEASMNRIEPLPWQQAFLEKNDILATSYNLMPEVVAERERAHAKHGDESMEDSRDLNVMQQIIAEEVGEVSKCFNEARHVPGYDLPREMRKELVQTAAMCLAAITNIDKMLAEQEPTDTNKYGD